MSTEPLSHIDRIVTPSDISSILCFSIVSPVTRVLVCFASGTNGRVDLCGDLFVLHHSSTRIATSILAELL
jgi:hypothetical protein